MILLFNNPICGKIVIFPRFKLKRFHLSELCFSRDSAAVRILIWYSIDTPTLNIEQASMVILRLLFFGFQFRANLANGKSGFLNMSMRPTSYIYFTRECTAAFLIAILAHPNLHIQFSIP